MRRPYRSLCMPISNGKPGAKLFDLVSPTEFAAGLSFFEAPPGTYADAEHLLRAGLDATSAAPCTGCGSTASDGEDMGPLEQTPASLTRLNRGADLEQSDRGGRQAMCWRSRCTPRSSRGRPSCPAASRCPRAGSTYRRTSRWGTSSGRSSSHIAERLPTSGDIERVQHLGPVRKQSRPIAIPSFRSGRLGVQGGGLHRRGRRADEHQHAGGRHSACRFTGWTAAGMIAPRWSPSYVPQLLQRRVGEHRVRRLRHRELRLLPPENAKVWTGCDASGDPHPSVPHGRHLSHGHGRRGHTERSGGQ